ncbi:MULTISPECIES: ABC transporter ATP-binding protein [Brevibacillus]|uniref:Multidrug ABC transporter ATP-binding protein n=1 Tax=Brevibacillus parabrevis TaxID=54914 RepID=A0A4Y3PWL0_BREPA|nr:ABC transporter ATP-binding protein [Brevibacillus parabrevis]MBU8712501.1 ABC transporter ATP-binding protein/permease [Brevibacillus parabrevis]MDR5000119.1 ABC transporter ATP-binding protein [Brevibacillus parabrevis]MED2256888.1 ABC transporter ATP-binding protein [Brevibacillus parabrevis]RNB97032.1 ABC transporter ATP-binding protein [Brevibacillus parabrevis]WDV96381.1 ABC transporter ATP-binding protein [Brevibacillus parabrevis]
MIRRFFSYYRPYKWLFMLDFGCAIIAGLLELAFPVAVNAFIDDLLPGGKWGLIVWASLGLLALYVVNTLLMYIVNYWGHMLGINIETDMRRKLFAHIQKLSFRFFDNSKTGHLIGRLTNDMNMIGEMAHHGPEDLFIAIMTLVGSFALMLSINWKLAVLTFVVVPVIIWVVVHFNKKMTQAIHQLFRDVGDFNARIEDSVGGIRVVKAFSNEAHEEKQFAVNNGRFRLTKLSSYKLIAKNGSISYMMMRFVTLFVMVCGTWFVIQQELSYGEFVGFLLLTNVFFRPIEKINAIVENYPQGFAGFKRYTELLDTEPDVADAADAVEMQPFQHEIRFDRVSFGYDGEKRVLNGVNLVIHKGETVAFVGPSGAGKTTLCSLVPRFYEVEEGSISVDGIDIRQVTQESLRRQIGIVQQDVFLFTGTIRENILYGKLDASEEEVWEAARRARLDEFIRAQEQGMDTVIGERGVKLSGGQKQRLAIARMFLKNPPILILDEATSALDTETELAIQQSLSELSKGRTTLVIAHRLATIKDADRIVVVTEQGIVEQGHHRDLVDAGGVYSRLYQAQFGVLKDLEVASQQ